MDVILYLLNVGKKLEFLKKEYTSLEKKTIGGLLEKKDHVDQIQRYSMILEKQNAQMNVILHVDVVNMLKYGITYLWSFTKIKMVIVS